ncbi:hypothetical protein Tsubulata_038362 [Turnera subulata]|uniref:Protein PHLOEM PROTEIN 2-LIKE A9-like n=1 Tax=Turnera subulata TaxID=218843 RepID=A0A9Q0F9W8_9ROSI|nr:hypothetical protein Tsubulata_038362 [Turnera subulata]
MGYISSHRLKTENILFPLEMADEPQSVQKAGNENNGVLKFYPKEMTIIWVNDKRYWKAPVDDEAPAELVQVCWLEVRTFTPNLPEGTYQISFKLSLKQGAFGWTGCPVFLMAKVGNKGRYKWDKLDLLKLGLEQQQTVPADFQIEVTGAHSSDPRIYFGLYEVWSGRWKGGLIIHEAQVKKVR